jgi:phenylalanyl-tRNA synthetase beta chain
MVPFPINLSNWRLVSGHDYFHVKGVLEALVAFVAGKCKLSVEECEFDLLDLNQSCELRIDGHRLGWLGAVSKSGRKQFGLRSPATVCEIDLATLEQCATLTVKHENQSPYPPVSRDFNFIVDNSVHWADLESTVRHSAGELLETVNYCETFRDEKKDGAGKKRLLMSVVLRSSETTLTGDQADEVCQRIVDGCQKDHSASLVS